MNIVGVVAEYNPFHAGHLFHLSETKKVMPDGSAIVAVMSGDFVQRGEPALLNKWLRAAAAVKNGVNLVLELPAFYATAAAPDFAYGAMESLRLVGASHISFGSEVCSIEELRLMADSTATLEHGAELKKMLSAGMSYSAAMSMAARSLGFTNYPNAVLASEYLKYAGDMTPILVHRQNTHGEEAISADSSLGRFSSAKAIRSALAESIAPRSALPERRAGLQNIVRLITELTGVDYAELSKSHGLFCSDLTFFGALDQFALYFVRSAGAEALSRIRGVGEGFENRLKTAALSARSADELVALSSTRRFTAARIRRIIIALLLGIEACKAPAQTYLRVLAYDETGRKVLSAIKNDVDIVMKRSKYRRSNSLLEISDRAAMLYSALKFAECDEHRRLPYFISKI